MEWAKSYFDAVAAEMNATPVAFFGQDGVKAQIEPFLTRTRFPHSLILGEPGIGKTHLARWIAWKNGHVLEELFCPVRPESLPENGFILLDEVHRQGHPEWLYPLMERDNSPTFLAATTRPELLEPAFSSRFFLRLHLERYDQAAMKELLMHWHTPGKRIATGNIEVLARAGAGNPRQLRRIYETGIGVGSFDPAVVLAAAQITGDGLTMLHLKYLKVLDRMKRPVGLSQLEALLYLDSQTIREHERLLLEFGLMELTATGRVLSKQGRQYVEAIIA